MGTIILSALVAHTGWHWMLERWDLLRTFQVHWPALDLMFLATAMLWVAIVLAVAGLVWVWIQRSRRSQRSGAAREEETVDAAL